MPQKERPKQIFVLAELHTRLKIYATERGLKLELVGCQAVQQYLKNDGFEVALKEFKESGTPMFPTKGNYHA